MTKQKHRQKIQNLRITFQRLAWISLCLSILTGIAHVRTFPSYNTANSLVAIYASHQDKANIELLLRSNTVCGLVSGLTTLADIAFCILWAGEITQDYIVLVRVSMVAFVLNMLIKLALLCSAITISVAASSAIEHDDDHYDSDDDGEDEQIITPKRSSQVKDLFVPRQTTPVKSNRTITYGGETVLDQNDGIPGLISPGYDPRNCAAEITVGSPANSSRLSFQRTAKVLFCS